MTGNFYDAAFRSEISFQDDESAGRLEWLLEPADNLLPRRFLGSGRLFGESASGNGDGIAAKQFSFKEALGDKRGAACGVKIGGDKTSSGFEICENGNQ